MDGLEIQRGVEHFQSMSMAGNMVTKRPVGRPSSYVPEVAASIIDRLANGEGLKKICRDPGMPDFSTVFRWEEKHEEFRELSARARELGTHAMADECVEIADDPDLDPNDKRVRIDTRLRLIGKWNRKIYGDRTELTGKDGGPIQVETRHVLDLAGMSDDAREEARELIERLRALQAVRVGGNTDGE